VRIRKFPSSTDLAHGLYNSVCWSLHAEEGVRNIVIADSHCKKTKLKRYKL